MVSLPTTTEHIPGRPGTCSRTYSCGCAIEGIGNLREPWEIRYCATHATAPDMLEALEQIVWKLGHNHKPEGQESRPGTIDRRDATVRMAVEAIAKAQFPETRGDR